MDSLSDSEIKDIWGRVKKYVPVSEIKAKDEFGIAKELDEIMHRTGDEPGKSGSLNTLAKKGFAERAARLDDVLKDIPSYVEIKVPAPPKVRIERLPKKLPENITRRKGKKVAIKTRTRTRVFSEKNINITRGQWKGKPAFWAYNTYLKKLITWGLA